MGLDKRFKKAEAVLAVFEDQYGDSCDGTVRCFSNCREQGFVISLSSWQERKGRRFRPIPARMIDTVSVAFSEARSSDGIVIYRMEGQKEMPDGDEWESAEYFSYDEYARAAKRIWALLTADCNRQPKKEAV